MQGRQTTIIKHCECVNAFIAKLSLCGKRINEANEVTFDRLSILSDTNDITMKTTRNSFKGQVHEIPEDKQDGFLELQHNSSAKDEFEAVEELGDFWVKMIPVYPQLSNVALRILPPTCVTQDLLA